MNHHSYKENNTEIPENGENHTDNVAKTEETTCPYHYSKNQQHGFFTARYEGHLLLEVRHQRHQRGQGVAEHGKGQQYTVDVAENGPQGAGNSHHRQLLLHRGRVDRHRGEDAVSHEDQHHAAEDHTPKDGGFLLDQRANRHHDADAA